MLRARFTKQGKLVRERNSKTALMCLELSVGDLLTTCKLKNTDATSHLHIDQISIVANKQSRCSSGAGDLLTTPVQNSYKTCFFGALNNGANTSNLMNVKC